MDGALANAPAVWSVRVRLQGAIGVSEKTRWLLLEELGLAC